MRRIPLVFVASAILIAPFFTAAAACRGPVNPDTPYSAAGKTITVYVPHGGAGCATSMQGCVATSCPSLDPTRSAKPMTVDCVRLGECTYATCASDASNYGKFFNLGSITYRSALDMKMYTVPNVTCFVHDTGGAFTGRPDKLDLATTVCPTCTEAQARQIGLGGKVDIAGGIPDPNVTKPVPAPTGVPTPTGIPSGGVTRPSSPSYTSAQPAPALTPATPYTQSPYGGVSPAALYPQNFEPAPAPITLAPPASQAPTSQVLQLLQALTGQRPASSTAPSFVPVVVKNPVSLHVPVVTASPTIPVTPTSFTPALTFTSDDLRNNPVSTESGVLFELKALLTNFIAWLDHLR